MAISRGRKAKKKDSDARRAIHGAKSTLGRRKAEATRSLEDLGRVKLEAWGKDLEAFVEAFSVIRHVRLQGTMVGDQPLQEVNKAQLAQWQDISIKAQEILGGGATAVGTGALVGFASYGGAMTLATASTGTAISSLSGVAATNATMAWFGGGSLASGGLGMAGGTAVLGGLVAGPALLVTGVVMDANAKKKLANAEANLAQARKAAASMATASGALSAVRKISDQFSEVIGEVRAQLRKATRSVRKIVEDSGNDYRNYTDEQKSMVILSVQLAQLLKGLVEKPMMTKTGKLKRGLAKEVTSARKMLADATVAA